MSSSRTAAVAAATTVPIPAPQTLMEVFAQVSDLRACRGGRHRVDGVLAAGLSATLARARSFAAIAQWSTDPDLLGQLGLTRSPSEATFHRVITPLTAMNWMRYWARFFTRVSRPRAGALQHLSNFQLQSFSF